MPHDFQKFRILFVTPEVSYLPEEMSAMPTFLRARAGELADFSAALISSLYKKGVDIHVALPDYRTLFKNNGHEPTWSISTQAQPTSKNGSNLVTYWNFNRNESSLCRSQLSEVRSRDRETRVHLANDRIFFNKEKIYSDFDQENIKNSLCFQREVINTIIRRVQPDLIHCNDWMTGLIPAIARKLGIPCLFTIHNVYNNKALLSYIEDRGIDAAYFWQNLFFEHQPLNYEETRSSNPVDFLTSGIFAAHFVNTTCPEFLKEIIQGQHPLVTPSVKQELVNKVAQGYASGISNSSDGSRLPKNDTALFKNYDEKNHMDGKKANKIFIQNRLGLFKDPRKPILFWPSCLDKVHSSSYFISTILYAILSRKRHQNLQIIFAARGTMRKLIKDTIRDFNLTNRVAVCNPEDSFLRVAYAASDFVLVPFAVEPVSSEDITGLLYGSLPIIHNNKDNHQAVTSLDVVHNSGNGFLFNQFDADSLMIAIDKAMMFYNLPREVKTHQISRIMKQSHEMFDHAVTVEQYLLLYEKMLKRPVCESMGKKGDAIKWFNDSKEFGFFAQEGGGPDVFLHQSETKKFG
ncbi:MAG: glycogen/starch synthase [Desulfobacter sp.]|nr:glycogen/starch synthase [Desulfobacter sp.]